MINKLVLGIFILLCIAQICIPMYSIYRLDQISQHGNVFKFKVQPYDPRDPFRGKFIAIQYHSKQLRFPTDPKLNYNDTVYARFTKEEDGFAKLESVHKTPPQGNDYIRCRVGWGNVEETYITLPMNKLFLNEKMAPEAERAYFRAINENNNLKCYALVAIYRGTGVLKDVYIEDMPIVQFVRMEMQKNKK